MSKQSQSSSPVISRRTGSILELELNSPRSLNSLNLEMIRILRNELEAAASEHDCRMVLISGICEHAFCAGGDIKSLARSVSSGNFHEADLFFKEEYDLDLFIHNFSKPVIVIADGITMGGGLGISAGADIVLATERTRMAMPEARIGFFPDVGATRWLFQKCPSGYPEFLSLTGYELRGEDCLQAGLATHFTHSDRLTEIFEQIGKIQYSQDQADILGSLPFVSSAEYLEIQTNNSFQQWVSEYFAGALSVIGIRDSLQSCSLHQKECRKVLQELQERSPTSLVLTLKLLRLNEYRALADVLSTDAKAAGYMIRHPDFLEGVRSRIIDKDNKPNWSPNSIEEVTLLDLELP